MATTSLAEPLETVPVEKAEEVIGKLIEEQEIEALVIGLSEGKMAGESRDFGVRLGQVFKLPVYFQDETLSSLETRQRMAIAGKRQKVREGKIDHLVAAQILQDFLDR
jgi:putative holliday junction resolvase